MNERDYSAELYEKMRAEQEQYRNYLLDQRPEEILAFGRPNALVKGQAP